MYQPGRKMVISDALSCPSTHQTPDTKETVPGLNVTIHKVGVFSNTDNTSMQSIRQDTATDSFTVYYEGLSHDERQVS